MATTITPSTLTVTIAATLDFGGSKTYNLAKTVTISNITEADKRIIPVPIASEVEIIGIQSAAIDRGAFTDFDCLILINQDDTNFVRLRISENGGDTADFRLDAGEVMFFWNAKIEVNTTEAAFGAFVTPDMISAQADTAEVDLEYAIYKV